MSASPTDKPLNEREQRFVLAYVGSANGVGAAACRAAGYKGSNDVLRVQGSRMLAKANVQAAIAAHRAQVQADGILTDTEVAVWLSGVVVGKVTEKKVTKGTDDDFVETEQAFDGKARITACGLLMKKMGYEAPTKTEHTGAVALEVSLTPDVEAALEQWLMVRNDPRVIAVIEELCG